MKAVLLNQFGGPEQLTIGDVPTPSPKADEVLIKISAAGINRPDIVQRNGHYPPPLGASEILGLECAGEIVELGASVTKWKLGDKVCALLSGGGYAEYALAHEGCCLKVPRNLSMIEAAALPETYFTVWSNLFDRAKLKSNETIVIHGGTSGIGTTAIQMAKNAGATVISTSGTDQKCNYCLDLGADYAINYKKQDFLAETLKYTNNNGVDVILDMVAGDYVGKNVKALKEEGRLVIIAVQGGAKVNFNILPVMLKRLTITGSTLRIRDNQFKGKIADALQKHIWPLIEEGKIKPIIDKTFSLDDVIKAHEHLESGAHMGKVILEAN